MRSDIIEDVCEDIYSLMGIGGPEELYDPEVLVEFLSLFYLFLSQNQELNDECEAIYEALDEEGCYSEDEDIIGDDEDSEDEDIIGDDEVFGKRIDLSECEDSEDGHGDSDSIPDYEEE